MGKEALLIVNPAAHNLPSRKRLAEADAWLREQGWQATWEETRGAGEAIDLAARAADKGLPIVFVCGGDGTLSEAANGLAGSETALAMIPAGTVNIWAKETRTPKQPLAAVRTAIEGQRRRIDLGRADGRYFLLMAGLGLDGRIAQAVSARAKRYVGATAYALSAVREALRFRGQPATVVLDGEKQETELLMLVAGNTRNYAGLTEVTPQALADDGLLDVCVFQGRGTLDIVLHVLRVTTRRHLRAKKVLYRQARRVEVSCQECLPLQLDGDLYPQGATRFEIVPSALAVMVPKGASLPLFSQ